MIYPGAKACKKYLTADGSLAKNLPNPKFNEAEMGGEDIKKFLYILRKESKTSKDHRGLSIQPF